MKPLGLIGGVGTLATTLYYQWLINNIVEKTGGFFPDIFMRSLSINTEIESAFIYSSIAPPAHLYNKMYGLLQDAVDLFMHNNVQTVVMPCNTLQPLLQEICLRRTIKNLNIIEETAACICRNHIKSVLILGSASLYRNDEYGPYLSKRGVYCKYLPADEQAMVERSILEILHPSHHPPSVLPVVSECIVRASRDVEAVVIGCTDLTRCVKREDLGIPVIDSLQILVDASTAYILSNEQ